VAVEPRSPTPSHLPNQGPSGTYSAFLRRYPEYAGTELIDQLRASDYRHLDAEGHCYLDYTGAGLVAESQLHAHAARIRATVFGNPHSDSPSSMRSTQLVESTRAEVLRFFNASPDEYMVIFTPNAPAPATWSVSPFRSAPAAGCC